MILEQFPNSETRIEILESVRNRHAFVVAESGAPVNERFMETLLLVQALKLADAARITVFLPYFPYSRQDRKADTRPPISAKLVTDTLKIAGANQIVTVDLHATQVEGFFDGPFENLSGLGQIVAPLIASEGGNLIVVSPDAGGAKRAELFARSVEKLSGTFTPLVVMSKCRPAPDTPPQVTLSVGPELLQGRTCILVDDMIDTGGSIVAAATALKEKGAARVVVCATHAVFSNNAEERMRHALTSEGKRAIDQIFITDTLPLANGPSELTRVISVAPLLAEAIHRLDQPMGTLRELKERTDLGVALPA
jgi:ribose-phosphate pyrophosphokinase